MKYLMFFLWPAGALALLLSSCRPAAPSAEEGEDEEAAYLIIPGERVGKISLHQAAQHQVLAAYGEDARIDSIHLGEGMMAPGVTVFPDDPRRMLEIYWDRELDPLRPAFIRIVGEDGASAWKTAEGITIGTSLEEVERLNGNPFSLYGFGWDAEGLVSDWHGGALSIHLRLRFQMTVEEDVPPSVWGDVVLRSDDPQARRVRPVVAAMELGFPRSDPMALLQGRWRSEEDPIFEIEIQEKKMRHFIAGEMLLENAMAPDPNCGNSACAIGSGEPLPGWCFIEEGEFDVQCHLLLSCDGQRLEYTAIGSTGKALAFVKIR